MASQETQDKIRDLQMIEQNIQNLSVQKQQFQSQIFEIDSAISELKNSKDSYKIIGNIMVRSESNALKKDLEEKKEIFSLRIKTIEKQEKNLAEKAVKMQKELMEEIKKGKE